MQPADVFVYGVDDDMMSKALLLRPTVLVVRNDTTLDTSMMAENFGFKQEEAKQRYVQQVG